jgi:microcystin degradation protein MlrC
VPPRRAGKGRHRPNVSGGVNDLPRPYRVAVALLSHVTNAFCPVPTDAAAFRSRRLAFGPEIPERYRGSATFLGGFLEAARLFRWDVLPVLCAWPLPGGPVDPAPFEHYRRILTHSVASACGSEGGLDAALMAFEGTLAVDGHPEAEGELVEEVAGYLGRRRPFVVALGPLANVDARLVRSCHAVVGCDTYPPVDAFERGFEAGQLVQRMLEEGLRPAMAVRRTGVLVPHVALRTAVPPMADVLAVARGARRTRGMLRVSVFGGFPHGDRPECDMTVVALHERDPGAAAAAAEAVERAVRERREAFRPQLVPLSAALDSALAEDPRDPRPTIVADVADAPEVGGVGDSPALVRAFLERRARGVLVAALWDPAAVDLASRTGVSRQALFQLGGRREPGGEGPLRTAGRVRAITDGQCVGAGPAWRGVPIDAGRTAVLELGPRGGVVAVVTERRTSADDPAFFRHLGLEPAEFSVLALKCACRYRAAFERTARRVVEVDTPGAAHPDLRRFPFSHLRHPAYPPDPA